MVIPRPTVTAMGWRKQRRVRNVLCAHGRLDPPHRTRIHTRRSPSRHRRGRATPTATSSVPLPGSRSPPTVRTRRPTPDSSSSSTCRSGSGSSRAVFVQASCHGTDNSAMVDALIRGGGRYAGVAMIDDSFTDAQIGDAPRRRGARRPVQLRRPPRRGTGDGRVLAGRRSRSPRSAGTSSCTSTPSTCLATPTCSTACRCPSSSTTWPASTPRPASIRSRSRSCASCSATSGRGSRSPAPSGSPPTGPPSYADVVPYARALIAAAPNGSCGAPTGHTPTCGRCPTMATSSISSP